MAASGASLTNGKPEQTAKRQRVAIDYIDGEEIARGAEGVVSRIEFLGRSAICKVRFSKPYRHPELDQKLTTRRLAQEARALLRLRREGIRVPAVYYIDCNRHLIVMEDLGGITLREYLYCRREYQLGVRVMRSAGEMVARMHLADVAHGDLTTSNVIVLSHDGKSSGDTQFLVSLIDFGLSSSNASDEDLAVDLYVLERAVLSAHSTEAEPLNKAFLDAYSETVGRPSVLIKLDEVRARGRKRDMVG